VRISEKKGGRRKTGRKSQNLGDRLSVVWSLQWNSQKVLGGQQEKGGDKQKSAMDDNCLVKREGRGRSTRRAFISRTSSLLHGHRKPFIFPGISRGQDLGGRFERRRPARVQGGEEGSHFTCGSVQSGRVFGGGFRPERKG